MTPPSLLDSSPLSVTRFAILSGSSLTVATEAPPFASSLCVAPPIARSRWRATCTPTARPERRRGRRTPPLRDRKRPLGDRNRPCRSDGQARTLVAWTLFTCRGRRPRSRAAGSRSAEPPRWSRSDGTRLRASRAKRRMSRAPAASSSLRSESRSSGDSSRALRSTA